MFGNPSWFEKYMRVKLVTWKINYGDTHFRRSDGGNAIFNPFADNNVMDELQQKSVVVYVSPIDGFMGMISNQWFN